MTRNQLKQLWFNLDYSNVEERKVITVEMSKGPYWIGYGTVEILSDGPNGYSSFKTHQEFPMKYVESCKEYKSGEYELVIKGGLQEKEYQDKQIEKLMTKEMSHEEFDKELDKIIK